MRNPGRATEIVPLLRRGRGADDIAAMRANQIVHLLADWLAIIALNGFFHAKAMKAASHTSPCQHLSGRAPQMKL